MGSFEPMDPGCEQPCHAEDRHRRRRHLHRPRRGGRHRPLHAGEGRLDTGGPVDRRDGRPRSPRRAPATCRAAELLAQTERIVHGTTVATNALLEHKGAKVGLLTTEGHRDVIEMREGLKDDRYNLRMPPPEQLVPRALRLGVTRAHARRRHDRDTARPRLARRRDRSAEARRRRGGGGLLSARLSRPAPRARDRGGAGRRRCRTPTSRCRPTCSRRSRSSSASPPRSSTPMSGRRCRAICAGWNSGWSRPAIAARC